VCDERRMLAALKEGTVHASDGVVVDDVVGSRKAASGRGVAQLVGDPLRPGETVTIDDASPGSAIRVKVRDTARQRDGIVTALFRAPAASARLRVAFRRGLDPTGVVLEDGHGRAYAPIEVTRAR
jgi:hypothetical protein